MSTTVDGPYRVLVVDDEALLRDAFKSYLQKHNFLVATSDSVEKAMPMLDEFMPHALIVDGNLPGAVGLTLAAHVRKSPRHKHVKIIAMSGDPDQERLASMLKSQYDLFLKKPFPMKDLIEAIGRLLPRKEPAGA